MNGARPDLIASASAPAAPCWPPRFERAAGTILTRHSAALRHWLRHDVALLDAEDVHDFRVTLRRLDSMLRLLKPLASPALQRLRQPVRRVFAALGAIRDLDEQLRLLDRDEALRVLLVRRRRAALRQLENAMSAAALSRWPARLARLLRSPRCWRPWLARESARAVASAVIRKRRRSLRRSLERLDRHTPLKRFHRARRRAKRFDDALADFEPWLGEVARPLRRELGRLRAALGDLQDAVVAERDFAALSRDERVDAALRRRARELAALRAKAREREIRRALRAVRALSPKHWRRVRDALGPAVRLEES